MTVKLVTRERCAEPSLTARGAPSCAAAGAPEFRPWKPSSAEKYNPPLRFTKPPGTESVRIHTWVRAGAAGIYVGDHRGAGRVPSLCHNSVRFTPRWRRRTARRLLFARRYSGPEDLQPKSLTRTVPTGGARRSSIAPVPFVDDREEERAIHVRKIAEVRSVRG